MTQEHQPRQLSRQEVVAAVQACLTEFFGDGGNRIDADTDTFLTVRARLSDALLRIVSHGASQDNWAQLLTELETAYAGCDDGDEQLRERLDSLYQLAKIGNELRQQGFIAVDIEVLKRLR